MFRDDLDHFQESSCGGRSNTKLGDYDTMTLYSSLSCMRTPHEENFIQIVYG